jgi:hypothetical protein
MAELDYAFVAEFAKVENGKLTAVGASFIDARPPALGAPFFFSVAGRIRAPDDTENIGLTVRINPPGNAINVVLDGVINPGPDSVRYDGKLGVLFAVSASILLVAEGLCEILIDVDKVQQRRLAFRVIAPS